MTRSLIFIAAILALSAGAMAAAPKPAPTLDPHPMAAELQFVTTAQKNMMARYPTAADAVKAGYFRYTNEDETGAVSYANLHWQSQDVDHPSQLWYDVNGKLLGADYSVVASSKTRPAQWGIDPKRWFLFPEPHVHYILRSPAGKVTYGYVMDKPFVAAGGDLSNPSAATIVALHKAPNAAAVTRVFTFPSIWDLIMWIKPNPNGAFAEANPLVKPSGSTQSSM